jgi:hypothetical protein
MYNDFDLFEIIEKPDSEMVVAKSNSKTLLHKEKTVFFL